MPIKEIESLVKESDKAQVSAARSACIAEEIRNGRDPEQAKAMCYQMVRDKVGHD